MQATNKVRGLKTEFNEKRLKEVSMVSLEKKRKEKT